MGSVEKRMEISLASCYLTGEETNYEIRETKFLGYLRTLGLKDTILGKNLNGNETDKR